MLNHGQQVFLPWMHMCATLLADGQQCPGSRTCGALRSAAVQAVCREQKVVAKVSS
jgi:hypothetical protein